MPSDCDIDFDGVFDDFANCEVTVTLSGVAVTTVAGIFNDTAQDVTLYDGSVVTTSPTLVCRTPDIVAYGQSYNDYGLTIRGDEYQFNGPPRGLLGGFTLISLTRS